MYTHYDAISEDGETILKQLANNWKDRVAVRKEVLDLDKVYDMSIPDFPEKYLPFGYDTRYTNLPKDTKFNILSAAWLFYNEKTIAVETEIVSPICRILLNEEFGKLKSATIRRTISQTLIDEEYHILMCMEACHVARRRRKLEDLKFPLPNVVNSLNKCLANCQNKADENVVRLSFAVVAETTINAYLGLLSNDKTIQRLNSEIVRLHKQDESAHNIIIRETASRITDCMTFEQKEKFVECITIALEAFISFDYSCFKLILDYFNIPDSDVIMSDVSSTYAGPNMKRNFSSFRTLIEYMGYDFNEKFPAS